MTVFLVVCAYIGSAVVAYTMIRARQIAVVRGPEYAQRREHLKKCTFCEEPGWFWTSGYSCYGRHDKAYPFSLSPLYALLMSVAWPLAPVVAGLQTWRERLVAAYASRVEADYYAQLDRQAVDKILREL